MKKKYMKPSMTAYDVKQPARLLVGSYDLGRIDTIPGGENRTWGQESCEKNQLA